MYVKLFCLTMTSVFLILRFIIFIVLLSLAINILRLRKISSTLLTHSPQYAYKL